MTAVTARLDVRPIALWQRHPKIFAAFDRLPAEAELEILSDHEPRPLRYEFDLERPGEFAWDQHMLDDETWLIAIRRLPKAPPAYDAPAFLRRSSLLAHLDEPTRERVIAASIERTAKAGAPLGEQGEPFGFLGFVQTGIVAAIALSRNGRELLVYEALPFETFAEPELLDGGALSARLVASGTGVRAILVPRDIALDAAARSPMFALRLGTLASRRMRALIERAGVLAFSSMTARMARSLLPYAAPVEGLASAIPPLPTMTQAEIATLAGTVRPVAARAIANLAEAGVIELVRGRIVRIDRALLQDLAAM